MEIEEDNLLILYNLTEAISNNVTVKVIQEGSNHSDFKAVLEEYKDIDLGWEDKIEIEEDNLLTTYNLAEAMSNNVAVEAIQKGPNHSDFKAVLEEYKDIQF